MPQTLRSYVLSTVLDVARASEARSIFNRFTRDYGIETARHAVGHRASAYWPLGRL